MKRARYVAQLQSLEEGQWVEYDDGQYGLILNAESGPIEWPTSDDETETVGDDGEEIYIVGRVSGGSKPFEADALTPVERKTVIGDEDEMPDNPQSDLDDAEMESWYQMISDARVAELHRKPVAELINVPGVEDPGVGFDRWPPSWRKSEKPARLILLDVWSSVGGTWTGAMKELKSRRLASAMKDEVYNTDLWRGRF